MKVLRWLLPLLSLAIVLLLTFRDLGGVRSGPGPLHPAHASLAELDHGANCEACHRPGAGIDAAACGKCHGAVAAQIASGRGLHGSLPESRRERCEACHSEHHGDTAPLLAPHAFQLAGYANAAAFDHRVVEWRLHGAHDGLACRRCHLGAEDVAPPAGGRFLGLTQTCTECHADVHHTAFGGDCESCHSQQGPWQATPGFRHEMFALRDAHRRVECAECHGPDSDHAVATLQRAPPAQPRQCVACHEDPHGSTQHAGAMRLTNTANCARCHDATTWAAAASAIAVHDSGTWPLRGAHATVACGVCHGDAANAARFEAFAPPALAACATCHEHPHGNALVDAAVAVRGPPGGCAGCHEDADRDFAAGRMDAAQHRATGFALAMPHADLACAKCHAGANRQQRFPGRDAKDCRGCHADVHAGQFDHEVRYRQCTACHRETTFRPADFGSAAHGTTAFPLTGAHDAVACARCHASAHDGVRVFHGTTQKCSGCHDDVHEGRFDRDGRPQTVAGRSDCARCHGTNAFAPVGAAFDHRLWTGHELTGAHAKADCTSCHPRAARGDAKGKHLGPAAGTSCAACHTDPHAGQFARGGVTDCARCHGTATFRVESFDHSTTRFPLDSVHAAVACASCHRTYDTEAAPLVRYRPLGTTCGDCHRLGRGSPHPRIARDFVDCEPRVLRRLPSVAETAEGFR